VISLAVARCVSDVELPDAITESVVSSDLRKVSGVVETLVSTVGIAVNGCSLIQFRIIIFIRQERRIG